MNTLGSKVEHVDEMFLQATESCKTLSNNPAQRALSPSDYLRVNVISAPLVELQARK